MGVYQPLTRTPPRARNRVEGTPRSAPDILAIAVSPATLPPAIVVVDRHGFILRFVYSSTSHGRDQGARDPVDGMLRVVRCTASSGITSRLE
jgi:hypothetical protein